VKRIRMAVAAVRVFAAWSFSRYKDHRTCPRYAHWRHILKKPEGPKPPAMQRGGDIHKKGELYLLGRVRAVPASFAGFRKEMQELRRAKAVAEGRWAMTAAWAAADFFDWANAWCRVVLDAHYCPAPRRARVIDFKTGRVYPDDNAEQMDLYAVAALVHYPRAEDVDVELWYLDQPRGPDNPHVKRYSRRSAAAMQRRWRTKATPIMTDRRFPPRPGQQCGRCAYSKRKGGDCEF
jgi:hypothetical protein